MRREDLNLSAGKPLKGENGLLKTTILMLCRGWEQADRCRMEKHSVDPPDGGYGWVVVTSAFFIMGLTAAVLKNFGLFFLDIQRHYSVCTSTTSWVTSTTIAVFHLGGEKIPFKNLLKWTSCFDDVMLCCLAPLASSLSMHLSQRTVIMIGGILAASGMVLASLGFSLPWMYASMGVLQGET